MQICSKRESRIQENNEMNCTIKINMENSAFDEGAEGFELGRILYQLAHKVQDHPELSCFGSWPVIDVNGNKIGTAVIK